MDGKPPLPLNTGRFSTLMRALGVVKGDQIVSEVHQQVFPVVMMEDDRPEHKYLAEERLAWGQNLLAAQGAGVTGFIGLRNPAGSGIILVLEGARVWANTINRFYTSLGRAVANLTQVNTEQPRDTRLQPSGAFGVGAPNIAGQIVTGVSSTINPTPFVTGEHVQASFNVATQAAVFQCHLPWPVILAPGDTFFWHPSDGVGGTTANLAFGASFAWRERSMEPTET